MKEMHITRRASSATQATRRTAARLQNMRAKSFEDLTPVEKDKLLKAVAVKLGMIADSPDA